MFTKSNANILPQTKLPPTLEISWEDDMSSSLFGALVAAGVAAAIACAAVTLIIARRTAKYRAKLVGLTTPDPEASKDYQDLCRARMQAKQPNEKAESPRITSLSREHESNNASSNRSSTSSWSEEPTISNMDISTGHMVLVSSRYNFSTVINVRSSLYNTEIAFTELHGGSSEEQGSPGSGMDRDMRLPRRSIVH